MVQSQHRKRVRDHADHRSCTDHAQIMQIMRVPSGNMSQIIQDREWICLGSFRSSSGNRLPVRSVVGYFSRQDIAGIQGKGNRRDGRQTLFAHAATGLDLRAVSRSRFVRAYLHAAAVLTLPQGAVSPVNPCLACDGNARPCFMCWLRRL